MPLPKSALLAVARLNFHNALKGKILGNDKRGIPSNADGDSEVSVKIAGELLKIIGCTTLRARSSGQTAGRIFEEQVGSFVEQTFLQLTHLRPGNWSLETGGKIFRFEQFKHLEDVALALKDNPRLRASLAADYLIKPDIVLARCAEPDSVINQPRPIVDAATARHADLRAANASKLLIHASISCKWTLRSDRAQNARTEAQNLIRNRKGRVPHIVAVSGEPTPARLSSLAYGTGDLDCVYHFALPELQQAINNLGYADAAESLAIMVEGKRLKDISDLPLDLAV